MNQTVQNFVDQTDAMAKKHKMKVSIGVPGEKEVVIADHTSDADTELAIENLIKGHAESIDKMKEELKVKKEMFNDALTNDATYRDHAEKAKEAAKQKTATKAEICKRPDMARLNAEIKDLSMDIKESKTTMGELLVDYSFKTGANQLELFDGQMFEIVKTAKLRRTAVFND